MDYPLSPFPEHARKPVSEQFTDSEIQSAIYAFLQFGEKTYGTAHQGYFSGVGFAARALRFHLKQLEQNAAKAKAS